VERAQAEVESEIQTRGERERDSEPARGERFLRPLTLPTPLPSSPAAMDAERRQAELIEQFSAQATALSNSAPQLAALVLEATSHPALFAFSELYAHPALAKVRAAAAGLSPAPTLSPAAGWG
jgi:hypothetical protein